MTYQPTEFTVKTLLGVQRSLEAQLPISPINDAQTTLNTKYGVNANTGFTANGKPLLQYVGVGIRGFHNIDDGILSEPNVVLATNMDLYTPLPIRVVPIEQDLSSIERANYRMRVVQTVGGDQYACYYLKKITPASPTVNFTVTDEDGVESEYVIDYDNMSPEPPDPEIQGVVAASANAINVSSATQILITGAEVHEAINVLYDGNMQYAKLSEIGVYMGEDQTVVAQDYLGDNFNYTEAIFCQLAFHRTWNGTDMSAPDSSYALNYRFSSESLVLPS